MDRIFYVRIAAIPVQAAVSAERHFPIILVVVLVLGRFPGGWYKRIFRRMHSILTIPTEDEERRRRRGRLAETLSSLWSVIEEVELGFWFFLSLGATPENLGFGQSWFTLGVQF